MQIKINTIKNTVYLNELKQKKIVTPTRGHFFNIHYIVYTQSSYVNDNLKKNQE